MVFVQNQQQAKLADDLKNYNLINYFSVVNLNEECFLNSSDFKSKIDAITKETAERLIVLEKVVLVDRFAEILIKKIRQKCKPLLQKNEMDCFLNTRNTDRFIKKLLQNKETVV